MLMADARLDTSQTFVGALGDSTVKAMMGAYAAMEQETQAAIRREIGAEQVAFMRSAEMRYRGQRHNIEVPMGDLIDVDAVRAAFDGDYERRYGHADRRAGVEIQALHLAATAKLHRPDLVRLRRPQSTGQAAPRRRAVYFESSGGFIDTPVYDRFALASGFAATGPAIVEEYGSTTVIWPEDRFEVGALGEIRIHCTNKDNARAEGV
jgi:N-methylhydantoinase A